MWEETVYSHGRLRYHRAFILLSIGQTALLSTVPELAVTVALAFSVMQNTNLHYTFRYNSLTRRRLIYESLEISRSHMFRGGRLYVRFVVFCNGLLMAVIHCKCEYWVCFFGAFNVAEADRWYPEGDAGCLLPLPVLQLRKYGTGDVGQNLVYICFRSLFLWMRKGRDASIFFRGMLQWLRVMSVTGRPTSDMHVFMS